MINDDDLALLATSFAAAVQQFSGPAATAALHDLGWADLLGVAPRAAPPRSFAVLGTSGSAASVLDDVLCRALGLPVRIDTCVVMPGPHEAGEPARRRGDVIEVDGLVAARIDTADHVIVAVGHDGRVDFVEVDAALLRSETHEALDPERPYRRAVASIPVASTTRIDVGGTWDDAVAAARARPSRRS